MKMPSLPLKQILSVGLVVTGSCYVVAKGTEALTARQRLTQAVIDEVKSKLGGIDSQIPALREDLGEHVIDGEVKAIDKATDDVVKTVMTRAFEDKTPGVVKGDHGKTLACLKGTISFNKEIPADLQRGVAVPGAVYDIESRLSNAEEPGRSDRSSTSQGVALKLKSVSKQVGEQARLPDFPNSDEQDFLMTSAPVFFLSNIVEYSVAFGLRNGEARITDSIVALYNNPRLFGRLGTEIYAKIKDKSGLAPGNPKNIMTHPYWSKHPYAWGERGDSRGSKATKYSVAPCENAASLTLKSREKNYQKEFITEAFSKNKEICFYFRVQTRPTGEAAEMEKTYPIEDGNVEWRENHAPFVNIAKIVFKADGNQDWAGEDAQKACAATEFSPWNGLMAHQPMSNLARGRRYVYKASALVRELKSELDPAIKDAK